MDIKIEKDDPSFNCPICNISITGVDDLKKHVEICSKPDVKPTISQGELYQPVHEVEGIIEIDSDEEEEDGAEDVSEPPSKKQACAQEDIDMEIIDICNNDFDEPQTKDSFNSVCDGEPKTATQRTQSRSSSSASHTSSDVEELLLYETELLESPYEKQVYTSFKSHCNVDDIQRDVDLLRAMQLEVDKNFLVRERVPWHVAKSATLIVDPTSFICKTDITVDGWTWDLSTYVSSIEPDENNSLPTRIIPMKGDKGIEYFRIVRRKYRCKQNNEFRKQIICILEPGKAATNRLDPFADVESWILVKYMYPSGILDAIPPCDNPRTYSSVKLKLAENMKSTKSTKKATYLTEQQLGGINNIQNTSFLPTRNQGRYIQDSATKKNDYCDALRELIERQHLDPIKFIRKIDFDGQSYAIFLMTETQLRNIANFCTTDNGKWKSELCWDFTFGLGIFDLLVLSYRNTTVITRRDSKAPAMYGGFLICHQRTLECVKIACDELISLLPGLKPFLRVNLSDGEAAIINTVCDSFPNSIHLLCTRHVEGNIRDHLPLVATVHKNSIMADIYYAKDALIESTTFAMFDEVKETLYTKWTSEYGEGTMQSFIDYFEKNKAEEMKYHVMKAAVLAADLNGAQEKIYNNGLESLNNSLKLWKGNDASDLYTFVDNLFELVRCQESEVLRAFTNKHATNKKSTYVVHPDFYDKAIPYHEYANLSEAEKSQKKESFLNCLVDPARFKEVNDYKAGNTARERARLNMEALIEARDESPSLDVNTTKAINGDAVETSNAITGAMPHLHINLVRDMCNKAVNIIEENQAVKMGAEFWVKAYSSTFRNKPPSPHVVSNRGSGCLACDCRKFAGISVCSHTIAVAKILGGDDWDRFLMKLQKIKPTLTKSASSGIRSNAGQKPKNSRKRKSATPAAAPQASSSAATAPKAPTSAAPAPKAPTSAAPAPKAPTSAAPAPKAPTSAASAPKASSSAATAPKAPTSAATAPKAPTSAAPAPKAPTSAAPAPKAPTSAAPAPKAPTSAAPAPKAPTSAASAPKAPRAPPRASRARRAPSATAPTAEKPWKRFYLKPLKGKISMCHGCEKPILKVRAERNSFVIGFYSDEIRYGGSRISGEHTVHFHLDAECVKMKYKNFNHALVIPKGLTVLDEQRKHLVELKFKLE